MSGNMTPLRSLSGSPHKGGTGKFLRSPLSPFSRSSEDSLRLLASDLERNNFSIPLNLAPDPQVSRILSSSASYSPSPPAPSTPRHNLSFSPIPLPNPYSPAPGYNSPHSSISRPSYLPLTTSSNGSLSTPSFREDSLQELKKENLNLKLRIYFLEERVMAAGVGNSPETLESENIDLKVQLAESKKDLVEKLELLV